MTTYNTIPDSVKNFFQKSETDLPNEAKLPHYSHEVLRVNLREYASEQAMAHKGDAKALRNLFHEIRSGHIIDENADFELQEKHQHELDDRITAFEKHAEELKGEKEKITSVTIPALEQNIQDTEKEIHQWQIKAGEPRQKNRVNKINLWLYGSMTVAGFIYLLAFYISAVYMGMIRNIAEEIQAVSEGTNNLESLFSAVFSKKAFIIFDFHWLAPILIFMLAVVLHTLWEKTTGKARFIFCLTTGGVVLALDALIAYKIEDTNHQVKTLMGLENQHHHWWSSVDFWIVLLMGFGASALWGLLLFWFREAVEKTDAAHIIALETGFLRKRIQEAHIRIQKLQENLVEMATRLRQVEIDTDKLKEQKRTMKISIHELERYITKFYDGWLHIVSAMPKNESVKENCEEIYQVFRKEYINPVQLSAEDEAL